MIQRNNKRLLRMAVAFYDHVIPKEQEVACAQLPTSSWAQCETLLHKIERASQHGWQLAARRLQDDLQIANTQLRNELFKLDYQLLPPMDEDCQASVVDIYADLVALDEEFEEVSFDQRGRTIAVTIEPIELEGVYLGPFKIQLDWSKQRPPYRYRVIALDANPAAANEEVTHPHVQGETVCEGEGHFPIHDALEQGRLLDFFVIVANLLRTYNSGSPYVSLSDWYGVECADCSNLVDNDERWICEKCETTVCGECYYNCPDCDGIYCSECVACCEGCLEDHCNACLKPCPGCNAKFCQDCFDKKERCTDCYDQEKEENKNRLVTREDDGARAPLQPDRLGQTAVPA